MKLLSTVLELVGVASVAAGAWVLAPWLGFVAGGVLLALVGIALDPPSRGGDR